MKFEILPTEQAVALRKAFIQRFVDATSEYYQKHIATLIQDIDGFCYNGYLWDCLQDNKKWKKECSMENAAAFLREKKNIFFMWDLFSKERLSGKRFSFEHPKATVISIEGSLLSKKIIEEWNNEHDAWTSGFQCQGLFSEYSNALKRTSINLLSRFFVSVFLIRVYQMKIVKRCM